MPQYIQDTVRPEESLPLPLEDVKFHVDKVIQEYFELNISEAEKVDSSYARLWSSAFKLVSSGGKRLRPHLCVLSYQVFSGKDPTQMRIMKVAAAYELLHQGLLIHDDIIDRDYTRYGTDNIAGQYRSKYYQTIAKNRDHYANSAALLMGDLLLTSAHSLVSEARLNHRVQRAVTQQLQKSIFLAAGGELLDTESAFTDAVKVDPIRIAELKTASYTFTSPMLSGAIMAGASPKDQSVLASFSRYLGIIFQLCDDILDVYGDPAVTDKSNMSDIKEGKKTLLYKTALQKLDSKSENYSFLTGLNGSSFISLEDAEKARNIVSDTGALAEVKALMENYKNQALREIRKLDLSPVFLQAFTDIAENSVRRVK